LTSAFRGLAVDVTPLRQSAGFRRLWIGQSIAYVAWRMMLVLVPVQVYRLTGSTLDVDFAAFVKVIPHDYRRALEQPRELAA